jgi:hypothetical protein
LAEEIAENLAAASTNFKLLWGLKGVEGYSISIKVFAKTFDKPNRFMIVFKVVLKY